MQVSKLLYCSHDLGPFHKQGPVHFLQHGTTIRTAQGATEELSPEKEPRKSAWGC